METHGPDPNRPVCFARRTLLKKAGYVLPVILTLSATLSIAGSGSGGVGKGSTHRRLSKAGNFSLFDNFGYSGVMF